MSTSPRVRAYMMFDPYCACGMVLYVPRPFLPTDPPVHVTCRYCGLQSLCSLNLDWFVEQAVNEALDKRMRTVTPR